MTTNNTRKTLTKTNIESMANEIVKALTKHQMDTDVAIYFNNKRINFIYYDGKTYEKIVPHEISVTNDCDPHKYFEYAAYHHILSMTFEGIFYDEVNERGYPKWFTKIFDKYGVYAELGNYWNLTCYPVDDNMKVEYTEYEKPKKPIYLRFGANAENSIFQPVMQLWRDLAFEVGDVGSCVVGAGFSFNYNNQPYFMSPTSPYQGSISWETDKDRINGELASLGCTEIQYHWGNMD